MSTGPHRSAPALTSSLLTVALSGAVAPALAAEPVRDPVADASAVVTHGELRVTVLTSRLLRIEWAPDRAFVDQPSLVFLNRRLPVPRFDARVEGDVLTVDTGALVLRYGGSGRPDASNLSIALTVSGTPVTWRPGQADTGNLRGTTRTLDGVKGATSLEPGLVSRDGWALVNDGERPLFDDSEWPWVMPRPATANVDWYFFGHGHDYKAALGDFVKVAGRIPLPPRFAFGAWWSRYWSYTDQEFMQLVRDFEAHDVPLDVLVIDMDWHLTFDLRWSDTRRDQAGHRLGWTGYTWNRALFPDPPGFLAWCEARGLKTPLNLHPASGVQPHEAAYPAMARAMGIDPATKKYVPFDITDKRFARNYLELLHHPLEAQGVDFWWLDWQQQHVTKTAGVNPTWWLNYVHTSDMERRGKRPLIFHRWGGLGNHRYQVGFSGDTVSVWDSLQFQPYFTATAANVGYAYWSHDIGGHMPGVVAPDLYTRWVQFGIFSPILRTHTTKNPDAERRIWAYPAEHAAAMREAFLLRYALVPYIYTEARKTHETGVAFFRPLYYDWPDHAEAYDITHEYVFGDSFIVAPITAAADAQTGLAAQDVWIPPGTWVEWTSGAVLEGSQRLTRHFALDEIPVYARAGAIVPLQPKMRHTREKPVDPLILVIFPAASSGLTRVYEDEGDGLGYMNGASAWTPVSYTRHADGRMEVTIGSAEGRYPGMAVERAYELRLPGALPPRRVEWRGAPVPFDAAETAAAPSWRYDGNTLTTVVSLPRSAVTQPATLTIVPVEASPASVAAVNGFPGKLKRLEAAMHALNTAWPRGWSPDVLVEQAQTGRRISLKPDTAGAELEGFERRLPEVAAAIERAELENARALRILREK